MTEEKDKSFYKMVFALVLPMALQNLINVAVTSADVIMLGKVSETVLSASSLAGQVQFVMTLFFFGITSGAAVLTAQYWGKKDTRTIEKILGIALRIGLIVAVLFTVSVLMFTEQIMCLFTKEQDVIVEGVKYLRIIAPSYIMCAISMVYLNIIRSVEHVMISTVVYSVSLVLNIILNSIFIFGLFGFPELGIQGAALATLCARAVELTIVIVYAKHYNKTVGLHLKDMVARDAQLFKDFMRYALPVIVNELFWGAAGAMNTVIIGHIGKSVVAANSVAQVARQLATVIAFGIANAAAIMIGKAIGENNQAKAKLYGKKFVWLSTYAGVLGALVILFIVRPVALSSLELTSNAQEYLKVMLFVMSYFVIAQAINTTFVVGIFRAGGDTNFGLIIDVATMWGGSILLGALAAFVFKLPVPVVYVLLMCDEVIKLPLTFWRYKKMKWLRNVTRVESGLNTASLESAM